MAEKTNNEHLPKTFFKGIRKSLYKGFFWIKTRQVMLCVAPFCHKTFSAYSGHSEYCVTCSIHAANNEVKQCVTWSLTRAWKNEKLSKRHRQKCSRSLLIWDRERVTRASIGKMLLFWMGPESFMGAGRLRETCDLYFNDLEW